jgi:beta-ribofuranosylaminobenzene 5'-phosphate synthase
MIDRRPDDARAAVRRGDHAAFGQAAEAIDRLTGEWFAGEQGGVRRPDVETVRAALAEAAAVTGAGQSSWGPTVYGVTAAGDAGAARDAGRAALDTAGVDGAVRVVAGSNAGARIERRA